MGENTTGPATIGIVLRPSRTLPGGCFVEGFQRGDRPADNHKKDLNTAGVS